MHVAAASFHRGVEHSILRSIYPGAILLLFHLSRHALSPSRLFFSFETTGGWRIKVEKDFFSDEHKIRLTRRRRAGRSFFVAQMSRDEINLGGATVLTSITSPAQVRGGECTHTESDRERERNNLEDYT